MVAEVNYTVGFVQQLDDLTKLLYKQGYHSFLENAIQYTLRIYDFTDANIKLVALHKTSPKKLKPLGTHYITYAPNNRTTWYILFFKTTNRYLVSHITNNHSPEAAFINEDN